MYDNVRLLLLLSTHISYLSGAKLFFLFHDASKSRSPPSHSMFDEALLRDLRLLKCQRKSFAQTLTSEINAVDHVRAVKLDDD